MFNLLDGIRKLKIQRQEALQSSGVVVDKSDELSELVSLYSAICEKSQTMPVENSTATDQNKAELELMEKSFSFRWNNLQEGKQKELVDRLLEKRLLPDETKMVLELFDGKVVKII